MARSVTFNGITQFRPGGLSKIDANALAQIGLSTNGIIGLIGEAEGGVPDQITTIDDPALAKSSYRNGPIADAIRNVFDPSDDPRVPGGAFRVLAIRTNAGTQSTLTLYNQVGEQDTVASSTTTIITLTTGGLVVDEMINNKVRVTYASGRIVVRDITDNAAGTLTVDPAFDVAPAANDVVTILAPMMVLTSRDYGAHTNGIAFEFEAGAAFGSAWTTTFDKVSQISDDLGAKSFLKVEYVGQSERTVQATGDTDGAGSTTQIVDSTAAFGTFTNFFVQVSPDGALDVENFRKISTSTGTQINVTNAFKVAGGTPTAPGSGSSYAAHTGQVLSFGAGVKGVDGSTNLYPTASWMATTFALPATLEVAASELVGLVLYISAGTGAGQKRVISANTAGISATVTVSKAWTTIPDATSVFQVRYVTEAKGSFVGSAGVATRFQTSVAVNGGVAAADLDIVFTPNMDLDRLVTAINANTNYVASIPSGVNSLTTLAKEFDFDRGATGVDLRNGTDAYATDPSDSGDYATIPWPNNFRQDLQVIVDSINTTSEVVSAIRSLGSGKGAGGGRPEYPTSGGVGILGDNAQSLSGGTRGNSTNSTWQTAFDKLLLVRANGVAALISQDLANEGYGSTATYTSVAAQLANHVSQAAGIAKTERGGYIGFKGTRDAYISQCNTFNNTDVQCCAQSVEVLDVDGNLTVYDEWMQGVIAAGMRAGVPEVGEPITHKYFRTASLTQDSSWDPADRTDANLLIQNGALFAEFIQGKGTRWVRDLTTYVIDDNLAFAEGSVRDVCRYVSYGLRTFLEDRFTGVKAKPANATSIKVATSDYLEECRGQNIIVDSVNDAGAVVHAYHNIRVNISGDIARIRVEVFPVVGINFQLTEIFLQLPRSAA